MVIILVMKKLRCLFVFVLLSVMVGCAIANDIIRDWGGVWQLNSADGAFCGVLATVEGVWIKQNN